MEKDGQTFRYKAFVSYAREDQTVAYAIRDGLEQLARPRRARRAFRVFLDQEHVPAGLGLPQRLTTCLAESEFLVVLVSRSAAQSYWVETEVSYWLKSRGPNNVLIVLVDGHLKWDPSSERFDAASCEILPQPLRVSFAQTPVWVDLRDETRSIRADPAAAGNSLSLDNPTFKLKVAQLQAPLRGPGVVPNDIVGRDLELWRSTERRRRLARSALTLLTIASLAAATLALRYANRSVAQAQTALSLQLASQSVEASSDRLDLSLLLALESYRVEATPEALGSMINGLDQAKNVERILYGHDAPLRSVAFSADGALMASSDTSGSVVVRDARSLEQVSRLGSADGQSGQLRRIAFSPEGPLLAAGDSEGGVHVWDLSDPSRVDPPRYFDVDKASSVLAVAFSFDGAVIAAGYEEGANGDVYVKLIEVESGRTIGTVGGHSGVILGLEFNRANNILGVASADGTVSLWSVNEQPERLATIERHSGAVADVAFSPNGKLLATAGWDHFVYIWDVSDPEMPELTASFRHDAILRTVAFSPDGTYVAAADRSHAVKLWNLEQDLLDPVFVGRHAADVWSVAFDPNAPARDPRLASASADETVVVWRPTRSPADSPLISGRVGNGTVRTTLYNEAKDLLILAGDVGPSLRTYEVGDAGAGESNIVSIDERFLSAALDTNTGIVLGGTVAGSIVSWDPEGAASTSHQITYSGPANNTPLRSMAFDSGKSLLAAGFQDGEVVLIAIDGNESLLVWRDQMDGTVWDVAFSPDGRHLAVSSGEESVSVRSIGANGEVDSEHEVIAATEVVTSLSFSADGQLVIVGDSDGTISVIDRESGVPVGQPMVGHSGAVQALSLDPSGELLASVSSDGTAIIWNLTTRQALTSPLRGHPDPIFDVAWILDGSALVTGGRDATLIWDFRSQQLRSRVCEIVDRDMTVSEWESFLGSRRYEESCGA